MVKAKYIQTDRKQLRGKSNEFQHQLKNILEKEEFEHKNLDKIITIINTVILVTGQTVEAKKQNDKNKGKQE